MDPVQTRQARTPHPDTNAPPPNDAPQGGDSVSLSLPELRKAIRESDQITEKLTAERSAWAGETNDPGQALGLREANQAYVSMQDAWFDELGVYIEALSLVHDGLERAANTYDETEQAATRGLANRELA